MPPFKVFRSNRESLVSQVMDGLRRAMATGFYRHGDILPRAKDMAACLGVSFTVMRADGGYWEMALMMLVTNARYLLKMAGILS